ncbi:MAG: NAD(P)H-dependent oxidoreductase [Ignavibacteria bacterium]|nr:NAD(P)H-dependent oxidoreductase [Ignavibacteria bacterium]
MDKKIKVLGFAGSLRKHSLNRALLRTAVESKPDQMDIEIFELNDIPLYNGDVEKEGIPDSVKIFREKISESDSLLIASPEYNYSFTGVLKNAIDWASRSYPTEISPLHKKPYSIMGASGGMGGTIRSQMHFRQVGAHIDMYAMNKPEVYVTFASKKFNESGELNDEPTREHLKKFLASFYDWTMRFRDLQDS